MPNFVDRYIIGSNTSGTYINESLPNITGQFVPSQGDNDSYARFGTSSNKIASGVFYTENDVGTGSTLDETSGDYTGGSLHFDASRSSNVYKNNARVRPNSLSAICCIKY